MPKRKHGRVFQAWTPHIWSNSNLIRWRIWSELAAILSSFAGRGFRSRVWGIIRTTRPPLTRLMSPLSEVAISILSLDRSDSIRSQLSLTYQKHWRQMLKSLTWMSGPWNQERISVSSKTPYCIMALISSPYLKRGRIYLCLTQASRSLITNFSDRIVDNIKLKVACAPTPSQITVLENLSSACDDGFQQRWLRVQCRKYKSFLICNTYRPPQTPTTCFESLANSLTGALLLDLNVVVLGDLNYNLLAPDPETTSLQTFISTFNLDQLVKKPTWITETAKALIDVILTTNMDIVSLSDVLACSVSDHHLFYLVLTLKTPRLKPSYVTIRSYANYNAKQFSEDLSLVPFHIISMFDDFDDQVETFNALFTDILDDHAPLKRVKIKSRPNPFISAEIPNWWRPGTNGIGEPLNQMTVFNGTHIVSSDRKSSVNYEFRKSLCEISAITKQRKH